MRLAGERVVRNRKFGCLQPLDFVAQTRGRFEFEIRRRLAHLFLEAGDVGADIVTDEGAAFLGHAGIDGDVVPLID